MKANIARIFEEVYEKESDSIFRFSLVRVSNREQALDITQETFLRLWSSLLEQKEIKNNRAFLFTIAHHLIIDWYRKKKSLSLDTMIYKIEEAEYYEVGESMGNSIELEAEGRYLLEKINELDPSARTPVYLRFVEDLSPKEISDILGISANAASVRINRGLAELRKKAGYEDDENLKDN